MAFSEQDKEFLSDALGEAQRIGSKLVEILNEPGDKTAGLIAMGGIIGGSSSSLECLKSSLALLSVCAEAEFELRKLQRERIANADA